MAGWWAGVNARVATPEGNNVAEKLPDGTFAGQKGHARLPLMGNEKCSAATDARLMGIKSGLRVST